MSKKYQKYLVALVLSGCMAVIWFGCGDNESCSIVENDDGTQTISCADGSETTVADASEGAPLVEVATEEAGDNCEAGGSRIEVGHDANGNGELDDDEVEQVSYNCESSSTLVEVEEVGASDECPIGGHRVLAGEDINDDGALDEDEIDSESIVCKSCSTDPETPSLVYNGQCLPNSAALNLRGTVSAVIDGNDLLRDDDFGEGDECSATVVYRLDLGSVVTDQDPTEVAQYEHTTKPYGIYATFGPDSVHTIASAEEPFSLTLSALEEEFEHGIGARSTVNTPLYGIRTESLQLIFLDEDFEAISDVAPPTDLPQFDDFNLRRLVVDLQDEGADESISAYCDFDEYEFL